MFRINKIICIIIVGIVILIGCVLIILNNSRNDINKNDINKNDINKNDIIKTDKEAIINRFPKLIEIKKCYWKADLINENSNNRVPGPSSYWMKGFVELDKDQISKFIDEFNMMELPAAPDFEFFPENYDLSASRWYYSDMFDEYILQPSFAGYLYIDNVNQVIYFDVKK